MKEFVEEDKFELIRETWVQVLRSLRNWWKNSQQVAEEDQFELIRETFERTAEAMSWLSSGPVHNGLLLMRWLSNGD